MEKSAKNSLFFVVEYVLSSLKALDSFVLNQTVTYGKHIGNKRAVYVIELLISQFRMDLLSLIP